MDSLALPRFPVAAALVVLILCRGIVRAQPAPAGQSAAVKVWQDTVSMETWIEGDPDPVPEFSKYKLDAPNYPYPVRSNLSETHRPATWRTLNLENEYLSCRILPDFGGHLHGCLDKLNGRQVFYANPMLRKALVGLRGAWASMGIESNFPVAHARATASPVDFSWSVEPDGSGRVVLEDTDRVTGMEWRVDYILRPGRAVLEQRVTFLNRGAARQPYLWWANAAVELDDPATRFIVPTNLVAEHGGVRIETWPISSTKRDESKVAGHADGVGWFAYGSREPFMAVYKPGFRSGVAHFADPAVVSGKKIWMWGSRTDDTIRQQINYNPPVEMQAGLFPNQETYALLEPQQTKTFTEYWIPFRELGGVSRATPQAIVNLERQSRASGEKELLLELGVTESLRGATLRLLNGRGVWESHEDLDPAKPFAHALANPAEGSYTFQLLDAAGKTILEYTENKYDALAVSEVKLGPQPPRSFDAHTEAHFLARGEYNESLQYRGSALFDYGEGMRLFPNSIALRKAEGRMAAKLHHDAEAVGLLTRVRAEAPNDEDAAYFLGVAQTALGNFAEARKVLAEVHSASPFFRAASLELARLAARDRDFAGALAVLAPALTASDAVQSGGVEVAILRRSGKPEEAAKRLTYWSGLDPADTFLKFERARLGKDDPELWIHLGADAERVLEIADAYMSLGFYEDAFAALERTYPDSPATQKEPGAVPPGESALISYYRAFCRTRLGQDAAADLSTASAQSSRYAFPSRRSSLEVLRNAEQANPKDALARLLAGRYYMHALMEREAIAEWQRARQLNPALPELYRDLAKALRVINKDAAEAVAVSREGLKVDPRDPELVMEFEEAFKMLGNSPASISSSAVGSVMDIAEAALRTGALGNPDAALRMFDPKLFNAKLEPDDVRRAYIDLKLLRLLIQSRQPGQCPAALDGLAKLGVEDANLPFTLAGFAPFMKPAHFQYYEGVIEAACGNAAAARNRWAKIAKQNEGLPSPEFAFPQLANAANGGGAILGAMLDLVQATAPAENSPSMPAYFYVEGMLLDGLGRTKEAEEHLVKAGKTSADPFLRYLSEIALREMAARAGVP